MAVPAPWEDPVSMAASAAAELFERWAVRAESIGLVVVGSESTVDAAKPIASFVHGLLGLPPECRSFDATHACYGGTAALRMAADWCAHRGAAKGQAALVVATDIARYPVGSPGEPTQGAGAVAMVVGPEASIFAFGQHPDAVYTRDVMDFWRPHYSREALVDGPMSIECYLRALEHTYAAYERSSGLRLEDHAHLLFHVPFPRMAFKGYRLLHEREARAGAPPVDVDAAFAERVAPALWANAEMGNLYSGSLYLSLAALLESRGGVLAGERVGLFSYGSGCCGEFFSGLVGEDPRAWEGRIGLRRRLARRRAIDYAEYAEFRRRGALMDRQGSYDPHPAADGWGRFVFQGVRDHRRCYARSVPSPAAALRVHRRPLASANAAGVQTGK
jgi:hydroxymethylglutaryl-CoA synthase